MKRLLLLRHAKTVPAGPGTDDHDRALMERGRADAPAMARYIRKHGYEPDLILSSTSRRTMETVELATVQFQGASRVDYLEALYLAEPDVIVSVIRLAPDKVKTLMVVGHNPGMEQAATFLAREPVKRKERGRFDLIEEKFPTAALAVLDFDVTKWRDVQPGTGALADFVRPPVTSDAALEPLLARIREAFPALPFKTAELNDYGEDNQVVVLDGAWIVRFPRAENLGRFAAELNLLDALGRTTLMRVPDYEFVARDKSFGAYRMILGIEMTPPRFHALGEEARRDALSDLAAFLTTLHGLPMATIAQPDGHVERCWSGEQFAALYRGMRRAKIARVVDPRWLARFDAFHEAFETVEPGVPRLAHSDLSDDHILVDEAGQVAGVIDFTDAAWGDPAIDFGYFWRLGEPAVDLVLTLYGLTPQDPGLKTRAHWTFVRFLINQLHYGDRAKWNLSVEEALAELDPHLTRLGF